MNSARRRAPGARRVGQTTLAPGACVACSALNTGGSAKKPAYDAPASTFWVGEAYHQHFYKTHAAAYQRYRVGCGRDARLRQLWGTPPK